MTKAPGGCRTCPGCHYSTKILYYTSRLRGRRGSEKVEDGRLDVVNAQIGRNPKLRTKILYCMTVLLRGRRYNRVKKADHDGEKGGYTMRLKTIVVGLALALPIPATSQADMYCGKSLIQVGDSAARVRKCCGKPHHKVTTKIGLSSHEEVWSYDFGSNRLEYTLIVRDGKIIKITAD
jgi:hypothetical protein